MEEGGVGIVFHTSRGGRVLVVKSLVAGGAAERSCAVEVGHQIIAVGDQDVTSATLEEVAGLLRGPVNSTVQLRFLETRDVRLVVERTFTDRSGEATVGIKWKNAVGEFIVEGTLEEYSGFGGSPKPGDRLLRIDGESIDDMRDDEIRRKLAGDTDSSVRLDFARGVAQHSVTLTRQALALAAITGKSFKSSADALKFSSTDIGASFEKVPPSQNDASAPGARAEPPRSPQNNSESRPSTLQALPDAPASTDRGIPVIPKKDEDSVNQQLVDIVRRLKQELEEKQKEVVNLKAAHRKELDQATSGGASSAQAAQELTRVSDLLRSTEQKLQQTQEELKSKDAELSGVKNELTGVKSVLTRRAEAVGDTRKKMDEVETALAQAIAEKEALSAKCQHLHAQMEQSQHSIRELKATRELDDRNLRAAADATLKWQIQEVEKQAAQAKADLEAKREEVNRANETIKIQAQSMMSWQSAQEATQSKLSASVEELNRLRKAYEEQEGVARRAKEEMEAQRDRQTQIENELERARKELGSSEEQYTRALQQHEQEWEKRVSEAEDTWKRKHAATTMQIASMQDQLDVGEKEREKMEEALNQAVQAKKQTAKECDELQEKLKELQAKSASVEVELAEVRAKLDQATGRAEKLTDASHSWRDQLAAAQEQLATAQTTIEAQRKACMQENNRREEAEEKLERSQEDVERQKQEITSMTGELKELKELRVHHEVAKERLKSFDQLQMQLQNDARQRLQYMQRVSGNVPYQQLLVMLQDSNSSVSSLQGVVQAKERQIAVIQQQLTELSNVREMTVDAEKQLMRLKEALDWKTITLQQMTAVLSSCQAAMKEHGMPIPEELLEQLSDVLALQSSRREHEEKEEIQRYAASPATSIPLHSSAPGNKPQPHIQPPLQMPGPAAVYGDQNSNLHASAGYPHQHLPPNQLPPAHIQMQTPNGGLHSSMGAPGQGGPPQGNYGSMPGMGGPGLGQGFGPPPPPSSMPVGMMYPGQRDSDFAMAM